MAWSCKAWKPVGSADDPLRARVSIADPKSTRSMYNTVFYYDTNDDGKLDRKEAPIDNHAVLVWRDTDLDGYFDEEFGFNQNSGWKSDSLRMRVRVPDILKHGGDSTTLQTDSI